MNIDEVIVKTAHLDHHGLIAATCQDVKLIERIDKLIGSKDPRRIVSPGQAVFAMVLNGLGFANRRLYLTPQFFESKPIERLLGENLKASDFDDHALGKALDEIADYGPDKLFGEVAFNIAIAKKLLGRDAYVDTTSYSTNGEYNREEPGTIEIKHGYSKDKRPDLKQAMMALVTTGAAQIPVWMQPLNGNAADNNSLRDTAKRVQDFQSQLKKKSQFRWVSDAAMYTEENLVSLEGCLWIMRVPERITEAKELVQKNDTELVWKDLKNGYKIFAHTSQYAGVKQRWILVYSEQAYQREAVTVQKNIDRSSNLLSKELLHLKNKFFKCSKDAESFITLVQKKFPLFTLSYTIKEIKKHAKRGRPTIGKEAELTGYSVVAHYKKNDVQIAEVLLTKGRFIVGTNDWDTKKFPDVDILMAYKEQQQVERGFRFLKDPWFMLDTFFLKSKRRIAALMAVMTFCLLIYNLAQHNLRQKLAKAKDTIPDQKGKPTARPTMRWVFQIFEGISVVYNVNSKNLISNLTELRKKIIRFFGPKAMLIYGI